MKRMLKIKSEGIKDSLFNILSSMTASAFSAVAVILISRELGPSNFAYFSTAFSLSLILNRLNDFGLVTVIQKYVGGEWRKKKINKYLSLCLRYRLILSIVVVSLGFIFSPQISQFLKIDNPLLIPLTFIFSVPTSFFESSQATLMSSKKAKAAALNYILPSIIKLGLGIYVYFWQVDSISLILGIYLLATLPSVLIAETVKPTWIKYQLDKKYPKEKSKILALLNHAAFGVIAAGLIENVDILFAKHHLTAFETGLLGGINRIAMFLYVVAYALANVLNPRVAKYQDRENLAKFIKKAWGITALSILGFFISIPLSPYLIQYTIGPEYLLANNTLQIMLAAGFISIALAPFMACFYALKNNSYFSLSAILQLLIVLIGNYYFVPIYGIQASAWIRLISRSALLFFTWLMLWGSFRKEFRGKYYKKCNN